MEINKSTQQDLLESVFNNHGYGDIFTVNTGPRNGTCTIEKCFFQSMVPTESQKFTDNCKKLIPLILQECHPKVQRSSIKILWLLGNEWDTLNEHPEVQAMSFFDEKNKIFSIGLKPKGPEKLLGDGIKDIVFYILHEIAEWDYYIKSLSKELNFSPDEVPDPNKYNQLEDEDIANRRAIRIMHTIYPDYINANVEKL